jgi:hypothetical protein
MYHLPNANCTCFTALLQTIVTHANNGWKKIQMLLICWFTVIPGFYSITGRKAFLISPLEIKVYQPGAKTTTFPEKVGNV